MTAPAPHNVAAFALEPFAPVGTSRLYCTCGRWSISIRDTDPWHWTISEDLPPCPYRRWWNAWRHQSRTELPPLDLHPPQWLRDLPRTHPQLFKPKETDPS